MINAEPAYSIGKSSYPDMTKKKIPGPGDYNPYDVKSKLPSYSFSKSPRKIHDVHQIPGPGVYDPMYKHKISGYYSSKSPRILSNTKNFSPGPGDYNYSVYETRYKYSITKARTNSYKFSDSPGPGHYSPDVTVSIESSPRFKFHKQRRMPEQSFSTPAPGYYHLPSIHKSPGYTIPKAFPKPKKTESPGPGVYEIPSTIGIASKT
jgi:Sperm-tail PG-rich repeat